MRVGAGRCIRGWASRVGRAYHTLGSCPWPGNFPRRFARSLRAGANTQGATLEEARTHLREAVILVVEANRMFALDDAPAGEVLREALEVTA